MVNRQLAEAGPRQLSQQVVRHPPPVLSELGCPALCLRSEVHADRRSHASREA